MMNTSDSMTRDEVGCNNTGTNIRSSHLGRLSSSTLSMRNKKRLKRHASTHHNSNFNAGYVPVTEEVLHRSGIRGRKRHFLYCTIAVLLVVACINLMVTAWLLYVLGMTHKGVPGFETIDLTSRSILHTFVPAFASSLSLRKVPLGSRHDGNLSFVSHNSSLHLNTRKSSNPFSAVSLDGTNITVTTDRMAIRSNGSSRELALNVETMASVYGIDNYVVDSLQTKKLKTYRDVRDIYLESFLKQVNVNGTKGVHMRSSKHLDVIAKNIIIQSNRKVVFQGKHSVYLDPSLPQVMDPTSSSKPRAHKVCLCGNGKLFYVPIYEVSNHVSCNIGPEAARTVCKI